MARLWGIAKANDERGLWKMIRKDEGTRFKSIVCDRCRKGVLPTPYETDNAVRRDARANGWARHYLGGARRDCCPVCAREIAGGVETKGVAK